MRNLLIASAAALALAACTTANTDDIGARVDGEAVANPAGQNSFSVNFDPENPGIPLNVRAVSGKDEENIALVIEYPDGTRWSYTADSSKGSEQTAAIVAAQEAIAALQAETGQAIAPAVRDSILGSVRAAMGLPGQ